MSQPRSPAPFYPVVNTEGGAVIDRLEIDANHLTFTARAAGPEDGRRVLLLHGFPQTSWAWRSQLTKLSDAGCRAVAPDQRGYSTGARPRAVSAYAMEHLVSDVLALADAMEMDTFDLVGHDWGGMVAWMVATHFPERLRSLTIVSTPHPLALHHALRGGDPEQAQRSLATNAFRRLKVPERLLLGSDGSGSGLRQLFAASGLKEADTREYIAVLTQPGAMTAALNWYRAMAVTDLLELTPITVPTLYIWSTEDAELGRSAAEATAECVSGPYQFVELAGVNHWIPEMAPDELSRLLVAQLYST